MSGVAGAWGESDVETVRAMLERQAHRGPDATGITDLGGSGTLGHRRLAVVDVESANQPIPNEDRSRALINDGEIFNFERLRRDLEARHVFRTSTDGESALHLYEELGPAMVRKLDGVFAMAVADRKHLFLARDPIGVKPLYYAVDDSDESRPVMFFASEIKALTGLEVPVREVPPGTCWDSGRGFLPYYRMPDHQPRERPAEVVRTVLRDTLEAAVEKRLMGDVPIGVWLSGGLDSSLVAALAARRRPSLHTFAVGIEGSADLEAARRVAAHIGAEHHESILDPDEVAEDLDRIVYHLESFDQDVVRYAIPNWYAARLAAEHVKIVLTGDGADELFGGVDSEEGHDSVSTVHRHLQRIDRMTMAHGVEGRLPFLDLDLVHFAQTVDPDLKRHRRPDGAIVDKWILRTVADDLLPEEIVWRPSVPLPRGSGIEQLIDEVIDRQQVREFTPHERATPSPPLRSREEWIYFRHARDRFGDAVQSIVDNAGRS